MVLGASHSRMLCRGGLWPPVPKTNPYLRAAAGRPYKPRRDKMCNRPLWWFSLVDQGDGFGYNGGNAARVGRDDSARRRRDGAPGSSRPTGIFEQQEIDLC